MESIKYVYISSHEILSYVYMKKDEKRCKQNISVSKMFILLNAL